eukprot:363330-Chlamydomonas_euryale.AAC.24
MHPRPIREQLQHRDRDIKPIWAERAAASEAAGRAHRFMSMLGLWACRSVPHVSACMGHTSTATPDPPGPVIRR